MGCKQSRPENALTGDVQEEALKDPSDDCVDCPKCNLHENEDYLFSPVIPMKRVSTPRELRRIRQELFSKDSLVAVASSATNETVGTVGSRGRRKEANNEVQFLETTSNSGLHKTIMSTKTNESQYAAAVFQNLKNKGDFVPSRSNYSAKDRVPSNQTTQTESESSSSPISGIVEESDHLVDTMAMSMEPLGVNSERSNCMRRKQPKSLGALVDSLTFQGQDDDEDEFMSCNGDSVHETDTEGISTYPTGTNNSSFHGVHTMSNSPQRRGSSKMRSPSGIMLAPGTKRTTTANTTDACMMMPSFKHSSTISAELLSSMKSQAYIADQSQDRPSVLMSFSSTSSSIQYSDSSFEAPDGRGCCGTSGGKVLQYHRCDSTAPKMSNTRAVCSNMGNWM